MASSATKQENGKWRCKAYYTDDAGKYTSKSFTAETQKEAEYLARTFTMERKHSVKPEKITLGQLADRFGDTSEIYVVHLSGVIIKFCEFTINRIHIPQLNPTLFYLN